MLLHYISYYFLAYWKRFRGNQQNMGYLSGLSGSYTNLSLIL